MTENPWGCGTRYPLSTGEVADALSKRLDHAVTEPRIQSILRRNPKLAPSMIADRRAWEEKDVAQLEKHIRSVRKNEAVRAEAAEARKKGNEQRKKRKASISMADARAKGRGKRERQQDASLRLHSLALEVRGVLAEILELVEGHGQHELIHLDSDNVDRLRDLHDQAEVLTLGEAS